MTKPRQTPFILSHFKCAGVRNWGRATELLGLIDATRQAQPVHLDCYPYTAGSTVISSGLADGEVEILINWSTPHPEVAGRTLKSIAEEWGMTEAIACRTTHARWRLLLSDARAGHAPDHATPLLHDRLRRIATRLLPHLATFPRVLGRYARELMRSAWRLPFTR